MRKRMRKRIRKRMRERMRERIKLIRRIKYREWEWEIDREI